MKLNEFINAHCQRHPRASERMQDFANRFWSLLSKQERRQWPYRRLQEELGRCGFAVGLGDSKRVEIGGLILNPAEGEFSCWGVFDGQLRRLRARGEPRAPAA